MTTMATTDAIPMSTRPPPPLPRPVDPVPFADRAAEPRTTRPMPPLLHDEPAGYRWSWLIVGLAVTFLFGVVVFRFYAPADSGVDQNAYLVGGRLISQHHTTRYVLPVLPDYDTKKLGPNPGGYAFTGGMMVRMPNGDYFPKYPAGLPLLYACFFWLFGPDKGPVWAFVVSPASAVAAVLGTFFLARAVAGSFAAVMAAILLGTSQVMLSLADNPNSHASCTAVVVWGMFLLVRWWQTGSVWQGIGAGFLIGYSFTIRYTEGLLVLPVAIACLTRLRWRHWAPWALSSVVGAVAVAVALVIVGVWDSPDWDVTHGMDRWFGATQKGPTVAAILAVCYAATALALAAFATVTVRRPAWWTNALDGIGWRRWGSGVQISALVTLATALVIVPLIGLRVYLKVEPAAVLDPAQWFGDRGRTAWWVVVAVLVAYTLAVGAASAVVTGMHWRWWTAFLRNIVPGLAWCVPVLTLVIYNSATMRHAAGYDTTNESKLGVAFKWSFLVRNWEMVVRTFDDLELFFVVPFAIAGLALVFRRSWRVGLLLLSWLVPGVLLYTSYYWSMDFDVAYARFYLSFLPALCVAAAVAFHDGLLGGRVGGAGRSVHTLWRPWVPAVEVSAALAAVGAMLVVARLWTAHDWDLSHGLGHWIAPGKTGLTLLGSALLAYAAVAAGAVVVAGLRPGTMSWSTLATLGGRIPTTLAVGLVVAVAAGVSSYRAVKGLRDGTENLIPLLENYRGRLNLARVGEHLLGKHPEHPPGEPDQIVLVDNVPARSVLFSAAGGGIQSPTNYIQFLRDWDVYPADAFSAEGSRRSFGGGGAPNRNRGNNNNRGGGPGGGGRNGGGVGGGFMGFGGGGRNGPPGGGGPGGGGPPGMGGNNDDQDALVATPVQPEQRQYHADLYNNVSSKQLYRKGGDVVRNAFANHRRVFAVVEKDALETFEDNLDEGGRFDYKPVAAWSDVALPVDRDEDATSTDDPSNRRGGGRMNNRRGGMGGGGMGGGMARLLGMSNQQNDWRIVEVIPEQPAEPKSTPKKK